MNAIEQDTLDLTGTTEDEIQWYIRQRRLMGYAVVPDTYKRTKRGYQITMKKRTSKLGMGWAWTDDDIAELTEIVSEYPVKELSLGKIHENFLPERSKTSITYVFQTKVCEKVYGISYKEFLRIRGADRSERSKQVKENKYKSYLKRSKEKPKTTVTRAVHIIEGTAECPEIILIKGERYIKQKAAQ